MLRLTLPRARLSASLRPSRISLRLVSTSPPTSSTLSTSADPSPSSIPHLPPPLPLPTEPIRRSHPVLYTVMPLPPLPPPLPYDVRGSSTQTYIANNSPTSSITPNSNLVGASEQLAVLNACLVSGDINRAEDVAKRLRSNWKVTRAALGPGVGPKLAEVLPPRVHADFIRACFHINLNPKFLPTGSSKGAGSSMTGQKAVQKAWSYYDALFDPDWIAEGKVNTAIDASVIAAFMKGLTASGDQVYHPSSSTMSDTSGIRPITFFLEQLRSLKINLLDVIKDPIFDVELSSYMGKVDRFAVLDALEQTGKGRRGWEAWEDRVKVIRATIIREKEIRDGVAKEIKVAPELNPTKSKDDITTVSLQTLRTNLSTLAPLAFSSMTPWDRQRLLEESSYDAARQLFIHEMAELAKVGKDKDRGMQGNWLQGVMFEWMSKLQEKFTEDSKLTGRTSPWGKELDIEPFLRLLKPDKLALITIVEVLRMCGAGGVSDGMKAARTILHIGKAIESEYHAQVLKEVLPNKEFEKELEKLSENGFGAEGVDGEITTRKSTPEGSLRLMWRREMAKREKEGDLTWRPEWSQGIRAKVGSILVTALMEVAQVERTIRHPETDEVISEIQPAFSHAYQYVRGLKLGIIKVNPVIVERMDSDPLRIALHPRFLPMIVQPKAWLAWDSGCYTVHGTRVMRTKDSDEQVQYLRQSSDAGTLDNIFSGLDVLGSLSWKINHQVFEVVSEVWNAGEALADIPVKDSLNVPLKALKPDNMDTDPRAKEVYRQRLRQALQERRALHSNRCDVNIKLEIGRAFLDETFYFPHNLDFRGRAYPIPPNLSHIGDDMCRGILQFAEAKPLGDRGLRWLKIHLANMRGFDKASFDEREAYAMEHLENVYDSADNPLGGKRWWLSAEDPWQCLGTCFELAAALRSPDPTKYLSTLPIHQDGTCNGLQHYAALGGDLKGASQVNLDQGDRPSDVYSGVAKMANEVIDAEAAAGNFYAQLLQGKVTRKVVKQTVMTTVYGVTFIGAKKQIEKQLKENGNIPPEHLYSCALFLGRIVIDSIGDVFKGATAIQTWLNRSARLIAKSIPPGRIESALEAEIVKAPKAGKSATSRLSRIPKEQMTSVVWTTPLGLPVVQPYRKPKKRQVSTTLQTVFIVDPSIPAEVDARAQATAFPPNFIHSLDATHMMMTALASKGKFAFASVHDSYWTHACSVDEMSVTLRDTFIELHSQDILGKLRNEFIERYKGHVVPLSKVPPGIRIAGTDRNAASRPLTKKAAKTAAQAGESEVDVFSELEAQDGDLGTPPFDTGEKISRVLDDGLSDNEEAAQLFWKSTGGTSNTVGSKLVHLADILPPVPGKGDFDLERIRNSLYFFS